MAHFCVCCKSNHAVIVQVSSWWKQWEQLLYPTLLSQLSVMNSIYEDMYVGKRKNRFRTGGTYMIRYKKTRLLDIPIVFSWYTERIGKRWIYDKWTSEKSVLPLAPSLCNAVFNNDSMIHRVVSKRKKNTQTTRL
jgi:hypothetical protein